MESVPITLAGSLFVILASAHRLVRGTTLQAVWGWTLFSSASLVVAELVPCAGGGLLENLRLSAALSTLCPIVAMLGAKRPQSRAWQWIVLSLWVVLVLPVAESYFAGRGAVPKIHDARGWFLIVLILLGLANYVATRHWFASWIVATSQLVLLAEHLPLFRHIPLERGGNWALGGLFVAVVLVRCGWPKRERLGATCTDRIWIDFRDCYGVIWSLRVVHRINDLAAKRGEQIRLSWNGLDTGTVSSAEQIEGEKFFRERFSRFLLRFVSSDWIHRRISEDFVD